MRKAKYGNTILSLCTVVVMLSLTACKNNKNITNTEIINCEEKDEIYNNTENTKNKNTSNETTEKTPEQLLNTMYDDNLMKEKKNERITNFEIYNIKDPEKLEEKGFLRDFEDRDTLIKEKFKSDILYKHYNLSNNIHFLRNNEIANRAIDLTPFYKRFNSDIYKFCDWDDSLCELNFKNDNIILSNGLDSIEIKPDGDLSGIGKFTWFEILDKFEETSLQDAILDIDNSKIIVVDELKRGYIFTVEIPCNKLDENTLEYDFYSKEVTVWKTEKPIGTFLTEDRYNCNVMDDTHLTNELKSGDSFDISSLFKKAIKLKENNASKDEIQKLLLEIATLIRDNRVSLSIGIIENEYEDLSRENLDNKIDKMCKMFNLDKTS